MIRYFASSRGGMPFERTTFPGLTVVGEVGDVDLTSKEGWEAVVDQSRVYPTGLVDDVFLHVSFPHNVCGVSLTWNRSTNEFQLPLPEPHP